MTIAGSSCSRLWEAAALDDGRLTEPDRSSLERHAKGCEECGPELAALAALRRQLSLASIAEATEIEHRRARRKLLREANERAVRPAVAPARLAVALGGVLALAVLALLVVTGPRRSAPLTALVEAPRSTAERSLAAGAAELPPSSASSSMPSAGETEGDSILPAAPRAVVARRAHHERPSPEAAAGQRFDEAVASFERGAYELADGQLERFAREHGDDLRAEDAAYLRAVARFRLGDREGAARLARAYLVAYPSGLRRPEAGRIAGE